MASPSIRTLSGTAVRLLTLQRVSLWRVPGDPRALASLWLGAYLAIKLASPDRAYWYYELARPLAQLGLAVMAGLLAAGLLGKAADALRFAFGFVLITAIGLLCQAAFFQLAPDDDLWADYLVPALAVIAAVRFAVSSSGWHLPADKARASLAAALVLTAALGWRQGESALIRYAAEREDTPRPTEIDAEQLWIAQPALLSAALARLPERTGAGPRTYVVGVAAGGMQRIFGREAAKAGAVLAERFGPGSGAAVLSNSADDLSRLPLANRTNLAAVLGEIGRRADPQRDLVVLYLASHGSRDGALSTDLPGYTRLQPITARFLADALRKAKIGRRMVVVSACYSGSWIKPLASPETILLTASAADRTSFGCDDKRDTTVFGEAFIRRAGTRGTSLEDAFAAVRADVNEEEASSADARSLPQSQIGANMQALWTAQE
ncbi:C13 family peptidase [Novosphingobium sp. PASSN1]|uniref:C13 family peptidase n=1 Tax=Novosphingobium sp. PASSN1 TaxID=2015561 RepID=UPI000BCC99E8|nr:C13 family peptidase [Novosphingobium sp. PASSN1]OYU34876.1 MAG: hypothetical protein CFE35_13405 [Novosphingobium sp. PASSN1]